jgi:hypothetical protein
MIMKLVASSESARADEDLRRNLLIVAVVALAALANGL